MSKHTRFRIVPDRERWNDFVSNACWGHLLQSWEWGEFKRALGWRVQRIGVEENGRIIAGVQLLLRRLPVLPLTIAYIPKGPLVDVTDRVIADELYAYIHQVARDQGAIFLRIEPNLLDDDRVHTTLERLGFRSTVHTNQPRSTLVIDLTKGEQALQADMRKTTRKLVRRAVRDGVEIVAGGRADLAHFYRVIASTSENKEIPIHDRIFYENAWDALSAGARVKLMLAKYQDEIVAAKIIGLFRDRSMHLWGGTTHAARDSNASYLLQWQSIKWAMEHGYRRCDLWGIPDQVGGMMKRGEEIPKHRHDGLWGVYTFKRGFGGEVEYYIGAYDYVYRPFLYWIGTRVLMRYGSVDTLSTWLEKLSSASSL